MDGQLFCNLWRLEREHLARLAEQDAAALAGSHSPEQQNVFYSVKVSVMQQAIAQVNTERFEDLPGASVAAEQALLHVLELGTGRARGQLEPGARCQANHGVL